MLLYSTCIAIDGRGVLLVGPSGCGKSEVALRLIDGGALLVADDQTLLRREGEVLIASPPPALRGMMEVRHVALLRLPFAESVAVALYVELAGMEEKLERLTEGEPVFLLDHPVQRLRLPAFAASTPAKIRAALLYAKVQ